MLLSPQPLNSNPMKRTHYILIAILTIAVSSTVLFLRLDYVEDSIEKIEHIETEADSTPIIGLRETKHLSSGDDNILYGYKANRVNFSCECGMSIDALLAGLPNVVRCARCGRAHKVKQVTHK